MFRRRGKAVRPEASRTPPADMYMGLRDRLLRLDPASVGLADKPLWGCRMETGYPNGIATLVCLADGTTSLYTSTGGGIIGAGAHAQVVRTNAALLATLTDHLSHMALSTEETLPREG